MRPSATPVKRSNPWPRMAMSWQHCATVLHMPLARASCTGGGGTIQPQHLRGGAGRGARRRRRDARGCGLQQIGVKGIPPYHALLQHRQRRRRIHSHDSPQRRMRACTIQVATPLYALRAAAALSPLPH